MANNDNLNNEEMDTMKAKSGKRVSKQNNPELKTYIGGSENPIKDTCILNKKADDSVINSDCPGTGSCADKVNDFLESNNKSARNSSKNCFLSVANNYSHLLSLQIIDDVYQNLNCNVFPAQVISRRVHKQKLEILHGMANNLVNTAIENAMKMLKPTAQVISQRVHKQKLEILHGMANNFVNIAIENAMKMLKPAQVISQRVHKQKLEILDGMANNLVNIAIENAMEMLKPVKIYDRNISCQSKEQVVNLFASKNDFESCCDKQSSSIENQAINDDQSNISEENIKKTVLVDMKDVGEEKQEVLSCSSKISEVISDKESPTSTAQKHVIAETLGMDSYKNVSQSITEFISVTEPFVETVVGDSDQIVCDQKSAIVEAGSTPMTECEDLNSESKLSQKHFKEKNLNAESADNQIYKDDQDNKTGTKSKKKTKTKLKDEPKKSNEKVKTKKVEKSKKSKGNKNQRTVESYAHSVGTENCTTVNKNAERSGTTNEEVVDDWDANWTANGECLDEETKKEVKFIYLCIYRGLL